MKSKILMFIAAGCGATLAAAAESRFGISLRIGAPPPVIVREEPPQSVVIERRSRAPAPGPNYFWVPTHHAWIDRRWVRVDGEWVMPPRPGAVWVEGRWNRQTQSWTEAHWEINQRTSYESPHGQVAPPRSYGNDYRHGDGAPGQFMVEYAPPPPQKERLTQRPSRGHVWIAGYWMASRGRHEWVSGHWEVPPRERAAWIAPRWEQREHNYVFIRGYWR